AQTTSSFKQDPLGHLGDTLSQFFVAFAILFVGTSLVNFDDPVARWANYQALLVTEFTNRLSGVIHLFFWLLLGILIYRYTTDSKLRPNLRFSLGILSLSAIALFPSFPYVTLFLGSLVLWQRDFFLELNVTA